MTPSHRRLPIRAAAVGLLALLGPASAAAQTARFVVEPLATAPAAPAVSLTTSVSWAGAAFVPGGDFEPQHYRHRITAATDAPPDRPGRIPVEGKTITAFNTLRDGALDGGEATVLRLEDGRLRVVREGSIPPGGFSATGWRSLTSGKRAVPSAARSFEVPVAAWERRGVRRWYALLAIDGMGGLSAPSEPVEVRLPETMPASKNRRLEVAEVAHDKALGIDGRPVPGTGTVPAPTGLAAEATGRGTVRLSWDDPEGGTRPAGFVVLESYTPPAEMRGFFVDVDAGPGRPSEPVRKGDMVILRRTFDGVIDRTGFVSDRVWDRSYGVRAPLVGFWPDERDDAAWRLRRHPARPGAAEEIGALAAGDWRGRTYLELELRDRAEARLGRPLNHGGTGQDYFPVLRPDIRYKVSVRLRGERPGRAVFRLTGPLSEAVRPLLLDYGTEWTLAEAEFAVPRILRDGRSGGMELVVQGPGRVDVDAFHVHPAATPYLTPEPIDRLRLEAGRPSALRTHDLIKTGNRSYDAAALLGQAGLPMNGFPRAQPAGLPRELETMRSLGVAPWLQVEPHLSDAEWLAFAEWLAAPAPAPGEEGRRPWAALRAAQGRAAPWAEAFDTIYLEIGNETWNRIFVPWTFESMHDAATGAKKSAGAVYGLFQRRVAEVLRSSPWWTAEMEEKVVWVIGGWLINGYGLQAAQAAGDAAELVTIAAYNGGWESGEGVPTGSPESVFNLMNQVSQVSGALGAERARELAMLARETGQTLVPGTYEAGPGYVLDGLNGREVTEAQAEAQERVMKSAAAGAATLDSFLTLHGLGYGMQNFFTFGEGRRWSSYAPWHRGGAPYPSWSWLALLNRLGWGEALAVRALAVPRADLEKFGHRQAVADAPLVGVHVLRLAPDAAGGGGRLVVAAISRRAAGHADGAPASDEANCTPVEIALPLGQEDAVAGLAVHRMDGAPLDHGAAGGRSPELETLALDAALLADGVLRIDEATGGAGCGLPAATALVYEIRLGEGGA